LGGFLPPKQSFATEGTVQKFCFSIKPYTQGRLWFFDDFKNGLVKEPLTDGVPQVITKACQKSSLNQNIQIHFSNFEFSEFVLDFQKPLRNGNVYRWKKEGLKCWFCPALFKYFSVAPKRIWFFLNQTKN
jgi:hypothetical protein